MAVEVRRLQELDRALKLLNVLVVASGAAAAEVERGGGDVPAAVLLAEHRRARHADILEVEHVGAPAGERPERGDRDARRLDRHEED